MARQVKVVGFANKEANAHLVGAVGVVHWKQSRYRMVVRFTDAKTGLPFYRTASKWENV